MKIIGLGKQGIKVGKSFDVSDQVGNILIKKGLAYKEGDKKPEEKKRGRKPKESK